MSILLAELKSLYYNHYYYIIHNRVVYIRINVKYIYNIMKATEETINLRRIPLFVQAVNNIYNTQ